MVEWCSAAATKASDATFKQQILGSQLVLLTCLHWYAYSASSSNASCCKAVLVDHLLTCPLAGYHTCITNMCDDPIPTVVSYMCKY